MKLSLGTAPQAYYNIRMKSKSGIFVSDYSTMTGGSYDPDHTGDPGQEPIPYNAPFKCELPMLDDTGADITLVQSLAGFQITISGWGVEGDMDQTAHEFEVIRTTLDNVNWNDYADSIRFVTRDRFRDIPTSQRRKWAVGVRPLQNKQVVGTPVEKTVVSAAMGVAPGDWAILNAVEVDLRTYSGTLTVVSGYDVSLTACKIPAGSATDVVLSSFMAYLQNHNCVLKDSAGISFIVDKDSIDFGEGDVLVTLIDLSDGSTPPSGGAFEINTTKRGRRLKVLNGLQIEMDAVAASFDGDIMKGTTENNPGVLRVCQNSPTGETFADILKVHANDAFYPHEVDFVIRREQGNLGLLFDGWDPSEGSPNNVACIRGRYTLYVRPHLAG